MNAEDTEELRRRISEIELNQSNEAERQGLWRRVLKVSGTIAAIVALPFIGWFGSYAIDDYGAMHAMARDNHTKLVVVTDQLIRHEGEDGHPELNRRVLNNREVLIEIRARLEAVQATQSEILNAIRDSR